MINLRVGALIEYVKICFLTVFLLLAAVEEPRNSICRAAGPFGLTPTVILNVLS